MTGGSRGAEETVDVYVMCTIALAAVVGVLIALLADGRARERAWRDIAAQRRYDREVRTASPRRL